MTFPFYPKHEHGCPHVGHCPHVGGASLGSVVFAANENDEQHEWVWRQIDGLREENESLREKNATLREQFEQLKLELKTERQNKFATNKQNKESFQEQDAADPTERDKFASPPNRRGPPVGHPGWYRPTPTHYDKLARVAAPTCCPHCQGEVKVFEHYDPYDHLQEDIVDGVYQVVLYRHGAARCRACRRWVQQAGEGEILGARLGPRIRAQAVYLRHEIGISSRKVPRALEELLGITFTPATLLDFERMLAEHAEPLVDDIAKKISSADGAVHADETYWTLSRRAGLLLAARHDRLRPFPVRHVSLRPGFPRRPGRTLLRHAGHRLLCRLRSTPGESEAEMLSAPGANGAGLAKGRARGFSGCDLFRGGESVGETGLSISSTAVHVVAGRASEPEGLAA